MSRMTIRFSGKTLFHGMKLQALSCMSCKQVAGNAEVTIVEKTMVTPTLTICILVEVDCNSSVTWERY
jgi:hypothetical protein